MKLTYQGITICLLYAATSIVAEMDYFSSPGPNSHYKSGDTISFVVEDMPDEDDKNVNANLYKSDQSLVKTLQTWNSQNVDESGEEFPFQWLVDVTESGQYYVEISVGTNRDDITQSYPFTIQVDDEELSTKEVNNTDDVSQSEPSQSDYAQQMSEETPEEAVGQEENSIRTNKLSLHNKQSQVAHISSHSDIDTLSDNPSSSSNVLPADAIDFQPQSKLGKLATSLTFNLPLGHHPYTNSPSQAEPLMPNANPTADMKELAAADDIAVAREKAWIAQQQKMESASHHTPSKHIKSTQKAKGHHSKIQKEITSQANKATAKGKKQSQKAKQQETVRQKLTLAQQEAKDDQVAKKEAATTSNNKHAKAKAPHANHLSKQKREAYNIVMRNRAKFAKQELQ